MLSRTTLGRNVLTSSPFRFMYGECIRERRNDLLATYLVRSGRWKIRCVRSRQNDFTDDEIEDAVESSFFFFVMSIGDEVGDVVVGMVVGVVDSVGTVIFDVVGIVVNVDVDVDVDSFDVSDDVDGCTSTTVVIVGAVVVVVVVVVVIVVSGTTLNLRRSFKSNRSVFRNRNASVSSDDGDVNEDDRRGENDAQLRFLKKRWKLSRLLSR